MTDRELLELAAKARGNIRIPDGLEDLDSSITEIFMDDDSGCWWNPLTDDGDALRLAVKLQLHIEPSKYGLDVFQDCSPYTGATEGWGDADRSAVTRQAIVLAAAEIGKAQP